MRITTREVTATTTAAQFGLDTKREYLYIENLSANALLFGWGATEPATKHTLAANSSKEWKRPAPTGKIWLEAAVGTCTVAITE